MPTRVTGADDGAKEGAGSATGTGTGTNKGTKAGHGSPAGARRRQHHRIAQQNVDPVATQGKRMHVSAEVISNAIHPIVRLQCGSSDPHFGVGLRARISVEDENNLGLC